MHTSEREREALIGLLSSEEWIGENDLKRDDVGGYNFRRHLKELADAGYEIECEITGDGVSKFKLTSRPGG